MKNVTVFLGSREANKEIYSKSVVALAESIAKKGHKLVYGGANVGTMGLLADSALRLNGHVIGVMPKVLIDQEITHPQLTELHIVEDMHARKMKLHEIGDVYIAMPGGCGTMEEIFEVITWSQIGIHDKPFCFMNIDGIYDGIKMYLNHANQQNFISDDNLKNIHFFDSVEALLEANFF
ncbi:MAG: TIGR00730 family Rossman fold protein [Erysipelothrix sp.]|nr:TIGR00730 family Rossman fold protein [Erysipelothrix sp.]